jgi:nitrogen fixation protein NifU and related proteins
MNDIMEMYQELIIDHARAPKNFGSLAHNSHHARGHNPLCGDIIDLELLVDKDCIVDIAFRGDGCAISKASSSLMTESIKGKPVAQALELFHEFHAMLTLDDTAKDLGKLSVLQGVKQFPVRVKCATLCWHTLNAALANTQQGTTTE